MAKARKLLVQQWGNSLALRIPAEIARAARIQVGQPVEIALKNDLLVVKSVGTPKLSLSQKLALFDMNQHGGEVLVSSPVGAERII